jgi:hypothetical protein
VVVIHDGKALLRLQEQDRHEMSESLPRHPLHRFPFVNTRDPNEVRHLLREYFDARYFDVRQGSLPFHVAWNYKKLEHLDLGYSHYNSAVSIGIAGVNMVRQMFSLTGSSTVAYGSRQFTADRDHSNLIPCGAEARIDRGAGHSELRLRIDSNALRAKLAAVIGTPVVRDIEFEAPTGKPESHRLRRLLFFLAGQLDCEDTMIPDQVLAEYEQLVMVSFLTANRHNFSHLLERTQPAPGPWQVRLVEEYIELNWKMPLNIETLAAVTGGSHAASSRPSRRRAAFLPWRSSSACGSPMQNACWRPPATFRSSTWRSSAAFSIPATSPGITGWHSGNCRRGRCAAPGTGAGRPMERRRTAGADDRRGRLRAPPPPQAAVRCLPAATGDDRRP